MSIARAFLKRFLIYTLILVNILSALTSSIVYSQNISFELKDVSLRNSAGYDQVYPGSRGATLNIFYMYVGSERISSVAACLYNIPETIKPVYTCSPARDLNQTIRAYVDPGDIIYFSYTIDIAKNASPGSYTLWLNISYVVVASGQQGFYTTFVVIQVSNYPPVVLSVRDSYLSPTAYPGTVNTNLYIVLENRGDTSVSGGEAIITLPQGFEPDVSRVQIPSIGSGDRSTIVVSGIGVISNTSPGTYYATLNLDLQATTSDGVSYSANLVLSASFTVESPPQVLLDIISYGWSSPKNPQDTLKSEYVVSFRNKDLAVLNSIVATLTLPDCMSFPNGSNVSYVYISGSINPGDLFNIRFDNIRIDSSCTASTYKLSLRLDIYGSRKGSEFYVSQEYILTAVLTNPSLDIRISQIFWRVNPSYPGSMNNQLTIVVDNRDFMDLESIVAYLEASELYPQKSYYQLQSIPSGSRGYLQFQLSVPPDVSPGVHRARLVLLYIATSSQTSYLAESSWIISYVIEEPPKIRLDLVDYRWSSGYAYSMSIGNSLEILLRNDDIHEIRSLILTLKTPPGIEISGRNSYSIQGGSLSPGSSASYVFNNIDIKTPPGVYELVLEVSGLAGSQGSEFWFNISYSFYTEIKMPEPGIVLVDYGWDQVVVYENTSRASIYIILRSYVKNIITSLVARISLENSLSSQGSEEITATYTGQISYGDVVRIVFPPIEVSSRSLKALLRIDAMASIDSVRYNVSVSYNLTLSTVVEKVLELSYIETLYQGSPAPLLASARDVVIRVIFINTKPEAISSLKPDIMAPPDLRIKYVGGTCLNGVSGGGSCYLDIYSDISPYARPGKYDLVLNLTLYKVISGSIGSIQESFIIPLYIEDPRDYAGIPKITTAFWGTSSPIPVFSNSKYVPLTIRIINLGRYEIQGLQISISSEDLDLVKPSEACPQPLASGAVCTVTLYTNINTSKNYVVLTVLMSYISTSYGSFIEINVSEPLIMRVENLSSVETTSSAVEYITSMWLEGSVGPNTMGAHLVLIFRNNYVESLKGAYLTLYLPEGFRNSYDNSSLIRIPPASVAGQPISLEALTPQNIASLLTTAQQGLQQTYSKGDFIIFIAQINILNVDPGIYRSRALLVYTDEIGILRSFETEITIPVLGDVKLIDVRLSSPIIVNSSYEDVAMYILNIGSAPAFNVYIFISPAYTAPLVIASPSLIYLERLDPGSVVSKVIRIAYNPYTAYQSEVRFGTTPLMISVVYRDPSGAQRVFNTSYTVVVEPFIKLYLQNLKAEYTPGGSLVISGSITNLGSATAQRLMVFGCVSGSCSSSFVGDLDPASQSVFRVEIPLENLSERYAIISIKYYDSYNAIHSENYSVSISIIQTTQTQTIITGYGELIDPYKIGVGAVVVTVVIITLYLIYRSVSRRTVSRGSIEGSIE
ncbi:MAG: hypothetical protein QXQ36_04435 [Sulfolobales archaeon]